jgi:polar amino acid transport system substrate-binding protein
MHLIFRFEKMSWLAAIIVFCLPSSALATDLTAYTEEWAPYNFREGSTVRGISSDLLRAACSEAKLECAINFVPWERAYRTVRGTPNTVLYTTARKPSREKEFIWVGPILPRTTWIYVRTGLENSVHTIKDLAKLRVGVVRGEAAHQDLQAAGVPESAFLVQPSNADLLKMLSRSMLDVMVETEVGMAWSLRTGGLPPNAVVKRMKLIDDGSYYFALNLASDPAYIVRLQAAIDLLRNNGSIDSMLKQYSTRSK